MRKKFIEYDRKKETFKIVELSENDKLIERSEYSRVPWLFRSIEHLEKDLISDINERIRSQDININYAKKEKAILLGEKSRLEKIIEAAKNNKELKGLEK